MPGTVEVIGDTAKNKTTTVPDTLSREHASCSRSTNHKSTGNKVQEGIHSSEENGKAAQEAE